MSSAQHNANQPKPESAGQSASQPKAQTAPQDPLIVTVLFHLEGLLKLIFVPVILTLPWYANHITGIICLLGVIRQCKIPKFNKDYGFKLITNEFTQNLFYIIPFLFFPGSNQLIYYFPLAIHFWLGSCQYVFMKQPAIYALMKGIVDFTRRNDRVIKIQRAKIEVLELAFIIVLAIAGKSSLVLFLLYGNFLRIKYSLNESTRFACAEINLFLDQLKNHPSCPGVAKLLIDKFRSLCGYLTKV